MQLKEQLVGKWEENSHAKVFQGVQISKYTQFLDNFQKSTGIDDRIRSDFENMEFTDRIDDKVLECLPYNYYIIIIYIMIIMGRGFSCLYIYLRDVGYGQIAHQSGVYGQGDP